MAIQAGALRHVVSIEYYDDTQQDTTGQPLKSWVALVHDYPCSIVTLSGRELYAASEKFAEATTRIHLRYLPDLTEKMRIVHDGPTCCGSARVLYNIVNIVDTELRHAELNILCKSGLNQG